MDPHRPWQSDLPPGAETPDEIAEEASAPACVLSFNASDASGAGGIAGDVATIAAMGAHALPVVTAVLMRDTAEIFDQHVIDADAVVEQARCILEDITVAGIKVGFLGNTDNVSAVAEVLSDYPDVPRRVATCRTCRSWRTTTRTPTSTRSAS